MSCKHRVHHGPAQCWKCQFAEVERLRSLLEHVAEGLSIGIDPRALLVVASQPDKWRPTPAPRDDDAT